MIFEKVVEIIKEELATNEEITMDTNLREDLNADSMDAVQLIISFEEAFGITIPDEKILEFTTVKKIVEYIENNK